VSDSVDRVLPPTSLPTAHGDRARRSQLPRLPARLLRRPRLERRLDQPAPIALVEGGAGYGKTILLASWLEHGSLDDQAVVWVTASAGLDRPDRFWTHLAQRLTAAGLMVADDDKLPFTLGALPGSRLVVVLDDFGHVRDPGILRGLIDLVRANRRVRLCVASRSRHPMAEPAAAAVEVVEITASELLLDDDETVALARVLGNEAGAQARWLREVTGGWVAVARTVLETAEPGEPLSTALDRSVDAYLSSSSGDREGLGRMLAGGEGPEHFLALPELHARVARWYLAYGGPRDSLAALHHAAAAGDRQLVLDVWAAHGVTLLPLAPAQLSASLTGLPDNLLSARPALGVARRIAAILGDSAGPRGATAALRAYAEASRDAIESGPADAAAADALFLATGHLIWFRLHGQLDQAVALAASVEQRFTPLATTTDGRRDWLAWFHLQQGQALLAAGREGEALRAWDRSWRLSAPDPRRAVPACAVASLALTHALAGRIEPARRWLHEYWELDADDSELSRLAAVVTHLALGWLALDRLDPQAVLGELERLAPAAASEWWPLLAALEADHALHFGDPGRGLERLDTARAAHAGTGPDHGLFGALLDRANIDLLLAQGELAEAREVLRRQRAPHATLKVPAARIHLLAGEYRAARSGGLRDAWDPDLLPRDRVELLLIHSLASLRSGEGPTAAYLARQALELHLANPVLRPWATLGPEERRELVALTGSQLPPDAAAVLDEQPPIYVGREASVQLTRREQVVLATLAKTGSRRDIANELYVSVNTIKVQLGSLYRKLGVSTRDAALAKARDLGLFDLAD